MRLVEMTSNLTNTLIIYQATRFSLPIRACPIQYEIINKMKKLDYKSGQYIFKAGDKGKEIFLLMSGDVGIFLPTNDTKDPNFKVGENEVFGEMGVIEHKPRMASARCMSDATVIALSESEFEARVEKADPFIRALLRILSQTVRNLQDKK